MYLEYWGLKKYPFEDVPDPEFMYYSREHNEGLVRLLYAVKRRKGAALLTGEVGCGKTVLSKIFIQQVSDDEYDIASIINPFHKPLDFLKEILYQFGLNNESNSKADLLDILNGRMLENVKRDKTTLLIIDEAQLIPMETFEEVRLLLNFHLNDRMLLTLILIGQPELKDIVKGIKQLDQRIGIRYHLNPLDSEEVAKYVSLRLEKAGLVKNIFTSEALDEVYNYTKGVPRRINNLCDMSLLIGFGSKSDISIPRLSETPSRTWLRNLLAGLNCKVFAKAGEAFSCSLG